KFGFTEEQFTPVRATASVFSDDMNKSQTALSSIGQFNTAATPLQMAMVASAIANDGVLMKPYMVDELQAPDLDPVEKTDPEEYSRPLSADNAQKLQSMMETVVKDGTGRNAQIPGFTVGGKTGTAQHGENNSKNPYAWFISYAKSDDGNSPVAVAVVLEDEDAVRGDISGGGLAAPIAKSVMEAVINSKQGRLSRLLRIGARCGPGPVSADALGQVTQSEPGTVGPDGSLRRHACAARDRRRGLVGSYGRAASPRRPVRTGPGARSRWNGGGLPRP